MPTPDGFMRHSHVNTRFQYHQRKSCVGGPHCNCLCLVWSATVAYTVHEYNDQTTGEAGAREIALLPSQQASSLRHSL